MNLQSIVPLLLCAALGAHAQGSAKKPARRASPAPTVVLLPATPEQIMAAALAYDGAYACELGQGLQLVRNLRHGGYVDLLLGKQVHTMKPVLSSTGVLRMEDVRGRLLLLQVPFKSMLLDVHVGRRLADDCVHAQQLENRRIAATLPVPPGLGIDPDLVQAAVAVAAASAPARAASAGAVSASSASAPASGASAPAGGASAPASSASAPASSVSGAAVNAEAASAAASGARAEMPPPHGPKP